MADLKPIETQYKGYKFRSRLEARWAVFFDAMNLTWDYELEGFDLGSAGYYLPDFYLHQADCFVEIKPRGQDFVDSDKYLRLCIYSKKCLMLIVGNPNHGEYFVKVYYPHFWFGSLYCNDIQFDCFFPGERSGSIFLKRMRPPGVETHVFCEVEKSIKHDPHIVATQARFEHGQSP